MKDSRTLVYCFQMINQGIKNSPNKVYSTKKGGTIHGRNVFAVESDGFSAYPTS
jgi:hypothetical protein